MAVTIALPKVNSTASVSDFSRGKAPETIARTQKEPVFVLNRNRPTAVIVGIGEYEHIREYMEDIEDARLAGKRLAGGIGVSYGSDEVMAHLGLTQAELEAAPDAEFE